jgi:hypothetical protein
MLTLLLRHPALDIKPASCGEHVDVGYDSVDTCTVEVGGVTLPIAVSDAENPDGFSIKPAGTIVESARAAPRP